MSVTTLGHRSGDDSSALPVRRVARSIVFDLHGSLLLLRYDPGSGRSTPFWVTPGGAMEDGETARTAAQRELLEETGLAEVVGEELWTRSFRINHGSGIVEQRETYFLVRVPRVAPPAFNSSIEPIREHRWWTMAQLSSTAEAVYPEGLAQAIAALTQGR